MERCATSTTPLNQLTSVTDQLGRQTVVHYDAAGRHLSTTYRDPRTRYTNPCCQTLTSTLPALIVDDAAHLTPDDERRRDW